ncbi:hypothetical protein [Pontibacillus litoralis]|uniref:Uncharacterized protein n=1 Tax=Pontibacillus litoralis JSM 072002 TaxID=1385512 RepID=A0A0A5GAA7_9BACI|nr:hypothetical protein [Pontibacillus litoralis]KGX88020.1 hypothetical protein N784_12560 [Pontibacillus litoralis JSM 072002]
MRLFFVAMVVMFQILAYIVIFLHFKLGIALLLSSYVMTAILLVILLNDRRKEKKEEEQHDYRDY